MLRRDTLLGESILWQDSDLFCFGTDTVLLYDLIPPQTGQIIDLCSGNGAVAMLLLAGKKAARCSALEIHPESCALARRSAAENGFENRLDVHCGDVKRISDFFEAGTFQSVCVNPPYYKNGSGILSKNEAVAAARHEIKCDIDDILSAVQYLLCKDGMLYMVHRCIRQQEVLEKIQKYGFGLCEIRSVFTTPSAPSSLFLAAAQKGQNPPCRHSRITLQNEDHTLSAQYRAIYEESL